MAKPGRHVLIWLVDKKWQNLACFDMTGDSPVTACVTLEELAAAQWPSHLVSSETKWLGHWAAALVALG